RGRRSLLRQSASPPRIGGRQPMRRARFSRLDCLCTALIAAVAVGCGSTPPAPGVSASPQAISAPIRSGPLTGTTCTPAMPPTLPVRRVTSHLINGTRTTGRFILALIQPGHTFQELLDYWNGPNGQNGQPPAFLTEVALTDVPANKSGDMN